MRRAFSLGGENVTEARSFCVVIKLKKWCLEYKKGELMTHLM